LFLDEPTVGLDPDVRIQLWEFFNSLTERNTTIIITSHTMDDATHCQRLAFLRQGNIIAQGSPDELKTATGNTNATLEDTFLYFIKQKETENVR
jgi:ABC-2 type transport system ATP-binding protein